MKQFVLFLSLLVYAASSVAQQPVAVEDSLWMAKSLDSVILYSYLNQNIIRALPAEQGAYIFSGKKTEMLNLAKLPVDVTGKTGRQVFAKVPGVFVYDMLSD